MERGELDEERNRELSRKGQRGVGRFVPPDGWKIDKRDEEGRAPRRSPTAPLHPGVCINDIIFL